MLFALTAAYPRVDLGLLGSLADAISDPSIAGAAGPCVILATCHRAEVYVETRDAAIEDQVRDAWAKAAGLTRPAFDQTVATIKGPPAVRHLFTVAAGLESMVLGEVEIGGQVSAAWRRAHEIGGLTPLLEDLFQSACRVARRVASETALGHEGRSLSGVALRLAGVDAPKRALIVGTGSFARVFVARLREAGCADVAIYSASDRATDFAAGHDARALAAAELVDELVACDVAILCSGRGQGVLDVATATRAAAARERELPVLDVALVPDAEPGVDAVPGIAYWNLSAIARSLGEVTPALDEARSIVEQELSDFRARRAARSLDPAIVALRRHVEEITRREVERLPEVGAEPERAKYLARRISQALLHEPTERARSYGAAGAGADYVFALDVLYGLQVEVAAADL